MLHFQLASCFNRDNGGALLPSHYTYRLVSHYLVIAVVGGEGLASVFVDPTGVVWALLVSEDATTRSLYIRTPKTTNGCSYFRLSKGEVRCPQS